MAVATDPATCEEGRVTRSSSTTEARLPDGFLPAVECADAEMFQVFQTFPFLYFYISLFEPS